MKFFSNVFTAVAVIAMGVVGAFAASEDAVVNGIQSITQASSQLQFTCSKLTVIDFSSQGFEIASGLGNLTRSIHEFNTNVLTGGSPFSDDVAQEVVVVATGFVEVHQALLNTIIGKHSLAAQFFLTAPIAAALRAIEAVADTFAFELIGLIPTQEDAAREQFNSLTVTFEEAIVTYHS